MELKDKRGKPHKLEGISKEQFEGYVEEFNHGNREALADHLGYRDIECLRSGLNSYGNKRGWLK